MCVCMCVCMFVPVLCVVGSLAGRKSSSYESSFDSSPSTEDQALSLASAMANCSATPAQTHTYTYTHKLHMYTCEYMAGRVTRRQQAIVSPCKISRSVLEGWGGTSACCGIIVNWKETAFPLQSLFFSQHMARALKMAVNKVLVL